MCMDVSVRPFMDVVRMATEVVRVNTEGPERGVLGSAFHAAYRCIHGEELQLSFGSQHLKLKELMAHCKQVEMKTRNTQPFYTLKV